MKIAVLALLTTLALAPACHERGGRAGAGDVERIVLVTIDTLRADHLGCYGAEGAETPHLDAIAAEGTRFETAITPTPITLPSHATLLTGRDPPEHGVRNNGFFTLARDVPTLAEHLRDRGFAAAAFVSAFVLDSRFGLERGFDVYDDRLGALATSAGPSAVPHRRGDLTVDAALAWLEQAPARFFLWIHLYDPHAPYDPPSPYAERFSGRPYDGEIAFADAQLGRLRAALAERWPEGTLWWVTADHGESLGEHGEPTHSCSIYDATQHVPLLASGPGVPRGRVQGGLAALADVTPTLLELAKQPPLPGATGVSLVAALGGAEPAREAAWVETLATQMDFGWSPLLGVRTRQHKYIRAPEPEVYDLAADPGEQRNLAAEQPELVAELDRLVEARASGRPIVPSHRLSSEERAQLEALGYLTGDGSGATPGTSLGVVGGLDPKREMGELAKIDELSRLLAEERPAEALALYDQIQSRAFSVLVFGAGAALAAGQPERAEREARHALALAERSEPYITIGTSYLQRGRGAEARASYERAVALDPESAGGWLGLAAVAESEGRRDDAIAIYEKIRGLPVPSPEALWRLAALYTEMGRRDEAHALLAEVPPRELRRPSAAERLARAERNGGRPELARVRVDGALREHGSSDGLWLVRAELLDQAGDLRGALGARREALRLAPERGETLNAVAWTLARLGEDLPEAAGYAERALGVLGRRPALLDTLALVRLAEGRYAAALALADEGLAIATHRDRVDLRFRRAEALAGLGRRDEAAAELGRAEEEAAAQSEVAWTTWAESRGRVKRILEPSASARRG